jgi:phosphate transport system permease protein
MAARPRGKRGERVIEAAIRVCGVASIVLVLLIFAFVFREGGPLFREYPIKEFLTQRGWQPTLSPPTGPWFGLLPNLWGSVLVTAGAIVAAVPLAVGAALCLAEVASRRLRDGLKPAIELLATVPSVAIGFVGSAAINPLVKDLFNLDTGKSALAGSVMLAFMAIPTIVTISDDALTAVPRSFRDGSLALGATRWQGISRVVFPAAGPGIIAAIMLGIGRAIGETMVVIMVTGNAGVLPDKGLWYAFTHSVRTITGTIGAEALEVGYGDTHYRALFMLGVVLFLITFVLNFIADLALNRKVRRALQ